MQKLKVEICHPTENDIPWIFQKIETNLVSPFETQSVKQLFEITPWSLIARQKGENKAYAAFMDYPCQDHYSTVWHQAIQNRWRDSQYFGLQTLFLHFMVCESDVKLFLEEILKVTFWSFSSLEYCCIVADKQIYEGIADLFERDESMDHDEFQFWTTKKDLYHPNVGIRGKRCEDYLELKNLFSRMYGPLQEDRLKKLTLDFLDYGEDRCSTYKYFTYDDDNTYVGIADNDNGRAIGFMYATIQRVDLDSMNGCFQMESVYGLRKRHPADIPEISFEVGSASESEESCDEEDEIRELVTSLVDEIGADCEIVTCLNDVLDEVCEEPKPHHKRRKENAMEMESNRVTLVNSPDFDLNNPSHLSLINRKNIKSFTGDTLVRLVNTSQFDPVNDVHMKLVPRLGKAIQRVEPDRIEQIFNSELFDPRKEEFATVTMHAMSYLPEHKLQLFQKSTIGSQIYEKLMYQMTEAKKNEITKTKKNKPAHKMSFKDTQVILHYTKNLKRKQKNTRKQEMNNDGSLKLNTENLKRIHNRNMGFISGLTVRGQYRVQGNCAVPKIKDPFGFENTNGSKNAQPNNATNDKETFEQYPVTNIEKELRLLQEIPIYNGGTNCFYVEQFAIEQEYESQSLHLVQAAFAYFPRVDYCMLLLPYGTRQVPYLRLYFSKIPARPFSAYGKELHVFHKAALNRSYKVRLCENDLKGVQKLISCSCLKEYLLKDLENSLSSKSREIQSVVLISEGNVFGIAIIKELKEVETIRRNYDVTERINMKYHKYTSQGLLLHCVIHPIFKFLAKVFLKEAMRLCQKSILYYKIYPTHLIPYDPSAWQSLCNVLEHLSPLKPFKKSAPKVYIALQGKEGKTSTKKSSDSENNYYCLSYTCTKMVLKDRNINSSRIVIVGDSVESLGILESLVYRDDYKFTNVAIITKCGIKGEFKLDGKCHSFLPIDVDFTKSRLDSLCLPVWVTSIRGEIVSIQRNVLGLRELSSYKAKHFEVGFDYLVICCDLEFQNLSLKKSTNGKNSVSHKRHQYPLLKELNKVTTYTTGKSALNVFSVNNAEEAAMVLNWLWRYFSNKVESQAQPKKRYKNLTERKRDRKEGRIVIYGNYLEAYSALAVIMAEDFPLSKIAFIKPNTDMSPFHTKCIEAAVDNVINQSEIEMITNATIEYDKELHEVTSLDVITEVGTTRLDCCALLLFHEKKINCNIFKTLHKSPLSFSLPLRESKGHPYLLINRNFQTNMENVFAVGTATAIHTEDGKFIRFEDRLYNKREIGMVVGENLSKAVTNSLHKTDFLPSLSCPSVTYVRLPSEYMYIFITNPTPELMSASDGKSVEYGVKRFVLGNLNTGASIVPGAIAEEIEEDENPQEEPFDRNFAKNENSTTKVGKDLNTKDGISNEKVVEDLNFKDGTSNQKATENLKSKDGNSNENLPKNMKAKNGVSNEKVVDELMSIHRDSNQTDDLELKDKSSKTFEDAKDEEETESILPDTPDYFALTFNKSEAITAVECLTKMDIDVLLLKNVYGIHIAQLHKVIQKVFDEESNKLFFRLAENWILPLDYVMFESDSQDISEIGYEGYWRSGYPEEMETRLNTFLDSFADHKKK